MKTAKKAKATNTDPKFYFLVFILSATMIVAPSCTLGRGERSGKVQCEEKLPCEQASTPVDEKPDRSGEYILDHENLIVTPFVVSINSRATEAKVKEESEESVEADKVECLLIFATLRKVGSGEVFKFDDCEYVPQDMYESSPDILLPMRKSSSFTIEPPRENGGHYVIRGFRSGKCIYYREWSRPIMEQVHAASSGVTVGAQLKGDRKIEVPKIKMGDGILELDTK